jgi:hypothetical protein
LTNAGRYDINNASGENPEGKKREKNATAAVGALATDAALNASVFEN